MKVCVGDLLEFDRNVYMHWAVYVGYQNIDGRSVSIFFILKGTWQLRLVMGKQLATQLAKKFTKKKIYRDHAIAHTCKILKSPIL